MVKMSQSDGSVALAPKGISRLLIVDYDMPSGGIPQVCCLGILNLQKFLNYH